VMTAWPDEQSKLHFACSHSSILALTIGRRA